MKEVLNYGLARDMLLEQTIPVECERIELTKAFGRILAEDIIARENVPAFAKSPYDGYALRAEDTVGACREHPAELTVVEEIPAGAVPQVKIDKGMAAKILTGAPVPDGADSVIMFEKTERRGNIVCIQEACCSGENIVQIGEDVQKGQTLSQAGNTIDAGMAGTLASQGIFYPSVCRVPRVGLISTGTELVDGEGTVPYGKIRNSNRYTLAAALQKDGCLPVHLGLAADRTEAIAGLIRKGVEDCDAILLTGGVSDGDYDLTPAAMETAGCKILAQGVDIKPGMACCYGTLGGKLVLALSGNPASSLTNYYVVVRPAIWKLCGRSQFLPDEIDVLLKEGFPKKSKATRFLRGTLCVENGRLAMYLPADQGNIVISSAIGCNVMAVVPAGSGCVPQGTVLKGFLI